MTLENHIENYLNSPFPLWNTELTKLLVEDKLRELLLANSSNSSYEYSIASCINNEGYQAEISILLHDKDNGIRLVLPSAIPNPFYERHGLELAEIDESSGNISKIKSALAVLQQVPEVYTFINTIVKSIQILKAEDDETDISYSHPDIPFSIFFSLCEEDSLTSDIRAAESILHEAMHLYLTLIENVVPLIEANTKEIYYSPWRDEERPVRGVLHGLFVFRAILDMYKIFKDLERFIDVSEYIKSRIDQIEIDIHTLTKFVSARGIAKDGATLIKNLLP